MCSQDGDRFWRMPECYIRGSTIKYLRIPDEVIDMVKEDMIQKSKGRGDNKGRGGGRGRGGPGRGRSSNGTKWLPVEHFLRESPPSRMFQVWPLPGLNKSSTALFKFVLQ